MAKSGGHWVGGNKLVQRTCGMVICAMLVFASNSLGASELGASTELLVIVSGETTHKFQVEVARTPEARGTGLMDRHEMAPSRGMLFIFNPAQQVVMWMRNTYISLDMLFIAGNGKIVRITEKNEPLSDIRLPSGREVSGVLEIVGGLSEQLGLRPGDFVKHPAFGQ